MVANPEKSWGWSNKVRNASIEKAEQMMEEGERKNKKEMGLLLQTTNYSLIQWYCKDCHKYHFWGGSRKYRLAADSVSICPKGSGRHVFVKEIKNVGWKDAYYFAPRNIRAAMAHDEQSTIFKL